MAPSAQKDLAQVFCAQQRMRQEAVAFRARVERGLELPVRGRAFVSLEETAPRGPELTARLKSVTLK